ncbi:MAG: 1-deoxy-D-xylulose-5-phosphate reductoisomerase [Ignavibacteria bacterium]|nr:1-deoxy-D-xylulose-5-phosphate reductoisomerase [Ignavibacteria bacterium]MBI3765145.1 1-deoxy-D-xylulose-5-phosphate reductoisomerase [Ignavibacteriales bacterium]
MKNICILGSTGSIGQNSLEVIANFPDRFHASYLTTNKNIGILQQQIERFHPRAVAVLDECSASLLKQTMNGAVNVFTGEDGLRELVSQGDIDIVINSLVGFAGLRPTIEAIKRGITVALANKETLVVAGEIITQLLREHNAALIPVDSEHSAILQCLTGEKSDDIARLILTASGGPFLNMRKKDFTSVTVEAALKHPNWKMGSKITIDSATMMNKGLEVIEAHWLFNLPPEKIDVLIHPQSIIHSMVEFVDGSVKAQLGMPDMKIPIQYALTYPERASSLYNRVDFAELREMTFFKPDLDQFECVQLAYDAIREGGTAPAILNAANEVAVDLFLQRQMSFDRIPHLIAHALEKIPVKHSPGLNDIFETDTATRTVVKSYGLHLT